MFCWQIFCGTIYTDTMIAGVRFALVNKLAQVYAMDFVDVMIYHMAHRKETHMSLSCYLIDDAVPTNLQSYNGYEMT